MGKDVASLHLTCGTTPCESVAMLQLQQTRRYSVLAAAPPVVTVALMPDDPMLDEEARAAEAAGLVALRFLFDGRESPELSAASAAKLKRVALPVRAVFRGFMMSGKRYGDLHAGMRELGVHMIVDPGQYERAHYFPNAYSAIEELSPRAAWVEVDDVATVDNAVFEGALRLSLIHI